MIKFKNILSEIRLSNDTSKKPVFVVSESWFNDVIINIENSIIVFDIDNDETGAFRTIEKKDIEKKYKKWLEENNIEYITSPGIDCILITIPNYRNQFIVKDTEDELLEIKLSGDRFKPKLIYGNKIQGSDSIQIENTNLIFFINDNTNEDELIVYLNHADKEERNKVCKEYQKWLEENGIKHYVKEKNGSIMIGILNFKDYFDASKLDLNEIRLSGDNNNKLIVQLESDYNGFFYIKENNLKHEYLGYYDYVNDTFNIFGFFTDYRILELFRNLNIKVKTDSVSMLKVPKNQIEFTKKEPINYL